MISLQHSFFILTFFFGCLPLRERGYTLYTISEDEGVKCLFYSSSAINISFLAAENIAVYKVISSYLTFNFL
jgi:hypothetical protein